MYTIMYDFPIVIILLISLTVINKIFYKEIIPVRFLADQITATESEDRIRKEDIRKKSKLK